MYKELLKLVEEHPELPVIPMVDYEVVASDDYGYWMGSFGKCRVGKYAIDYCHYNERVLLDEDEEELIESIAETKYNGTDEDYKRAEEEAKELWHDAIIVFIGLPEV